MIDQGIYLVIKSRASSFSSPSVPATSRPCPHRLAEIASHRSREKEVTRETPTTSCHHCGVRVHSFPSQIQRDLRGKHADIGLHAAGELGLELSSGISFPSGNATEG